MYSSVWCISGFQNGIQSADEARQQLESVLERLKEDKLLQDEEIHSSKTSQESIKQATKKRKPSTKRKRKKEESSENSPALSGNFSNGSNGTENRPALSGSVSNSLAGVENMDRESMPEPMNGKRKRSRTDGEVLESPQFSLSKSSGIKTIKGDDNLVLFSRFNEDDRHILPFFPVL